MARIPPRKQIHVVALENCTALGPVGFADLLRKARGLAVQFEGAASTRPVEVILVSAGATRTVLGAGGLQLRCDARIRDVGRSDIVLVPPLDEDPLGNLEKNRALVPWLEKMYAGGAEVASACTGAFALAEAGLLSGRAATTHWAQQQLLQARYPRVKVERQAVLVRDGRICTAGGATSFFNLILYLIEQLFGPQVARAASRMFLIDEGKSPQSAYEMFLSPMGHGDEQILRAQVLLQEQLRTNPSVGELARVSAMSRRTFIRRFKLVTGHAPRDYIRRQRVEVAKRALEETPGSVSSVADKVGYGDVVAFRKVFVRETGLTPIEYRRRFAAPRPPAFLLKRR